MNRTQLVRTSGMAAVILVLIGYTIYGTELGAENAANGSPTKGDAISFSCATLAISPDGSSPSATPGGASLELSGLSSVSFANGETVISGIWRLPVGTSLQIESGEQAWIQVSDGAIALGPCGGTGVIDTKEGDDQVKQMAAGASQQVDSPSAAMLFLDESPGSFHLTATDPEGALVWIEVLGATADGVFCDEQQCWGMADATPIPSSLASPGAGCAGVRCWTK